MSVSGVLQDTVIQSIGGIILGSIIDNGFSKVVDPLLETKVLKVTELETLQLFGEIVLQLGAGTLLATTFFDFSSKFGSNTQSPSTSFAFYMAMMTSQPNLLVKVNKLTSDTRDLINFYMNTSLTSSNAPMKTMQAPTADNPLYMTGSED